MMDGGAVARTRRATRADFPWMKLVATICYSGEYYQEAYGDPWLLALMEAPNCLVLRGVESWMAIEMYPRAGSGARMARFQMIASIGHGFGAGVEMVEMTKRCVAWAKEQGAYAIFWEAVTGVDLGPLARAVGAEPVSPAYQLRLQ